MRKFRDQRMNEIFPYIKEKDVLDVGCYAEIKGDAEKIKKPSSWIHGFLVKNAKSVTGIDIEKEYIKVLKKQGYNVHYQDAENFKFNKKFDVIFVGDVIEHLSNPGLCLDKCRKHTKKGGWLIITTPNVFCLNYKIGGIIRPFNNDLCVHPGHTCFLSPTLIKELMKRYGFEVKRIKFVNFTEVNTIKKFLQNLLCKVLGENLRYNMMVFAQPKN